MKMTDIEYEEIVKGFIDQNFIDHSLFGVGIYQDGLIKYANDTALNITGYPIEFFEKKGNWKKIIYPDDLEDVKSQIEVKLDSNIHDTTRYKTRIIIKSGVIKLIEVFTKKFVFYGSNAILITLIEIKKPLSPNIYLKKDNSTKKNKKKYFSYLLEFEVLNDQEKQIPIILKSLEIMGLKIDRLIKLII